MAAQRSIQATSREHLSWFTPSCSSLPSLSRSGGRTFQPNDHVDVRSVRHQHVATCARCIPVVFFSPLVTNRGAASAGGSDGAQYRRHLGGLHPGLARRLGAGLRSGVEGRSGAMREGRRKAGIKQKKRREGSARAGGRGQGCGGGGSRGGSRLGFLGIISCTAWYFPATSFTCVCSQRSSLLGDLGDT